MSIKEAESGIVVLEIELAKLDAVDPYTDELRLQIDHSREEVMMQLDTWNTIYLVRHPKHPKAADYIRTPFSDFVELRGDCCYGDDAVCQGGIAAFHGGSITVLTQSRGEILEENIQHNFGMLHPEGCRKTARLAKQTERFRHPIITLVDTAGACPGKGAKEHGQAETIAQCLAMFSGIRTSVFVIVLSENSSSGAPAFSAANYVMMLEHVIYSILFLGSFASILWKDEPRVAKVAGVMELTAPDLKRKGIIDTITAEPKGGAHIRFDYVVERLREQLENIPNDLYKKKEKVLLVERYEKYRVMEANCEEL